MTHGLDAHPAAAVLPPYADTSRVVDNFGDGIRQGNADGEFIGRRKRG
jgi:hypothetical protein